MTCTSGERTAETISPPRDYGVGLKRHQWYYADRDPMDPMNKWSARVMKIMPDLQAWLDAREIKYRIYERKLSHRLFGRPRYQLAVRFQDYRMALLFIIQWDLDAQDISIMGHAKLCDERCSIGYDIERAHKLQPGTKRSKGGEVLSVSAEGQLGWVSLQ